MAKTGGQIGNKNAAKGKRWTMAIERALAMRSKIAGTEALDALAEELLKNCASGDMVALKELGDRLEGKAAQAVTGPDGGPVQLQEVPWLKTRSL